MNGYQKIQTRVESLILLSDSVLLKEWNQVFMMTYDVKNCSLISQSFRGKGLISDLDVASYHNKNFNVRIYSNSYGIDFIDIQHKLVRSRFSTASKSVLQKILNVHNLLLVVDPKVVNGIDHIARLAPNYKKFLKMINRLNNELEINIQ